MHGRSFFLRWNALQLLFGAALCWLSSRAALGPRLRRVLLAVTLLVAFSLFVLTPLITHVGRSLDFVPRDPPPPALARFQLLHVAYTGLEVIKLGCLGLAAFWLLRRSSPEPAPIEAVRP